MDPVLNKWQDCLQKNGYTQFVRGHRCKSYLDNTFLDIQVFYSKDTLSSKFVTLQNAIVDLISYVILFFVIMFDKHFIIILTK